MIPDRYITVQDAAVAFGVHPQTVRRWYRKGEIATYHKDPATGIISKKPRADCVPGMPALLLQADVARIYNEKNRPRHAKGRRG